MDIYQIIAIAIIGSILTIMLKAYKPEFAIGVSILTGTVLLFACSNGMQQVFSEFESLVEQSGIDVKHFLLVIKIIGIAYLTQFASEICKDGGQNSIALKLELAGKVFVMLLTMPVIKSFLQLIISVLN